MDIFTPYCIKPVGNKIEPERFKVKAEVEKGERRRQMRALTFLLSQTGGVVKNRC